MNIATIIAKNYLPQARVLAKSFRDHHADGNVWVVVIDDPAYELNDSSEPFQFVRMDEVGLATDEFHRMAMIYSLVELSTAIKPWVLRGLLEKSTSITYLDPDIQIFAPLDEIDLLAHEHKVVLTPHMTKPMPKDQLKPTELDILKAGVYNLGFIAVSHEARPFLDWWSDHLKTHSLNAPERGLMVDQRWVDLVPGYFGAHVLRDPTYNVAYWNLANRNLEWTGSGYTVNSAPLRFFHFSGFSPLTSNVLSKFQIGIPRIDLAEHPGVAKICRDYADLLLSNGFAAQGDSSAYLFDSLSDGTPITHRMRWRYRTAILDSERRGTTPPPDPFAPFQVVAFGRWYKSYAGIRPATQRLMGALKKRGAVLAEDYPTIYDLGRQVLHAGRRVRHNLELRKTRRSLRSGRKLDARQGVNVVGYFRAESGVGEAGRAVVSAVRESGVPFASIAYSATPNRQDHAFVDSGNSRVAYNTNVICVNADALPSFSRDIGPAFFRDRYNIGLWMWEVEDFPRSMHDAFHYVDEVWAASRHVANAISKSSSKPVNVFPVPVIIPAANPDDAPEFARSELFKFLFVFDFLSVFERKNPLALIEAFKQAFPNEGDALLIVKSISGDRFPNKLAALRTAAGNRQDIRVVDGYLSSSQKNALMAICDCYVSLHRSEGFGLTIAEAMALGKPVIGTGYSGNLEFMNEENSFLVSYTPVSIPEGCPPYPKGSVWAEPNVDDAAGFMRLVFGSPNEAKERGDRAREDILSSHSPAVGGVFLRRRLEQIWSSSTPASSSPESG